MKASITLAQTANVLKVIDDISVSVTKAGFLIIRTFIILSSKNSIHHAVFWSYNVK